MVIWKPWWRTPTSADGPKRAGVLLQALGTGEGAPAGLSTPPQPFIALDSGFDSGFDSRFPAQGSGDKPMALAQFAMLKQIHDGKVQPESTPVTAGYGPGAALRFDFSSALVIGDAEAWSRLRLERLLPGPAVAGTAPAPGAQVREMDLALWDLGVAAGEHPLLGAPLDWWHRPLLPVQIQTMARYTVVPVHREMAWVLEHASATPSSLRRECRTSVHELRCFLQGCLFLGLVHWPANDEQAQPRLVPLAGCKACSIPRGMSR